ncbi:hypothetical protein Tco_0710623 [Tanacetum coccineum]
MHANTPYKGAATAAAVEPAQAQKLTCVSILNNLVINPIRRDRAGADSLFVLDCIKSSKPQLHLGQFTDLSFGFDTSAWAYYYDDTVKASVVMSLDNINTLHLCIIRITIFHAIAINLVVFYSAEYKESALVYWHVEIDIRALVYRELDEKGPFVLSYAVSGIRGMSQSLSSNVPDNSPEQEAATGYSIPRRLDSSTPQATQLPGLELTLTLLSRDVYHHHSHFYIQMATTFLNGKPASETLELNPEDVTARLEDIQVEIDTLHADTEDKELLISELKDLFTAAENEISLLQIRTDDAESRRAEDHEQIQKILTHLGL